MNEFKTFHPIVNFTYFVFVIGFSMFFMHPAALLISLTCGFTYSVMLSGKRAVRTNLIYMISMMLIMALINPAFNHEGTTILAYLPSGNPLTLESIIYGLCSATMIVTVICWFACYTVIMTSDKFIYLFGTIIPSLSLIISMTLRFVPKFSAQLKVVTNAQRCMGSDISNGSLIQRAKHGLNILSIMTTWALENAIDTADSMKARGYGIPGRTAFSIFIFDKRDRNTMIYILITGLGTLIGSILGGMDFTYFPAIKGVGITPLSICVFSTYFLLCIFPVLIELMEVRRWAALKSKI